MMILISGAPPLEPKGSGPGSPELRYAALERTRRTFPSVLPVLGPEWSGAEEAPSEITSRRPEVNPPARQSKTHMVPVGVPKDGNHHFMIYLLTTHPLQLIYM